MGYAYLACPYSHPSVAVREARYVTICRIAGSLFNTGTFVFSPIAHCHKIAIVCDMPKEIGFWRAYDNIMLDTCDKLIIAKMDGWEESAGVKHETEYAMQNGIPIEYLDLPEELRCPLVNHPVTQSETNSKPAS